MGGKNTPQAPDPVTTAAAQTQSNEQTAAYNQKLNLINSTGPNGSVSYHADPSAPGGYGQTTTLSPAQQSIYDQGTAAQAGALGVANQQIGRVGQALQGGLNPSHYGSLTYGTQAGPIQTSAGSGPSIQSSFNPGAAVQTSYGAGGPIQGALNGTTMGDPSVQRAIDASYGQATSRLDPQWQQAQNKEETALANQGLSQNSDAYQTAMANFGRDRNDAYTSAMNSAVAAGQAEQAQLFGQGATAGAFANAAQAQGNQQNAQAAAFANSGAGQQFLQNQGAAQFANAASDDAYARAYQNAGFANAAQNQGFNQASSNAGLNNAAQQQAFQQGAYAQQQPINEFNALMSSSQVASPNGVAYTPSQSANTDVIGAYNSAFQNQLGAYNAQNSTFNSALGGLFGLGSAFLGRKS